MGGTPQSVTRVFFVRHAVTSQTGTILYGRTKGIHLSDEGKLQAKLLGELMKQLHIDSVYSSPLERAHETANEIARHHSVDVVTSDKLLDTDVGEWTNYEIEKCNTFPEWKAVMHYPTQFTFPGGESLTDVFARCMSFVSTLVDENPGKNIVVVCHRDPIIALLSGYLGLSLDHFQRIPCIPASMSEVCFYDGIAEVKSINVVPVERMG